MKKGIAAFLSFVMLTVSLYSCSAQYVYAAYEPDDDFFAFMIEYVKQRNMATQLKGYYDQYKQTGLSLETAWELAKNQVSNNYVDVQAALSAIKTTYKNLSSKDQWSLIDFYNQVNLDANFNIDANLYNSLNLDLFSNNVWDNSEYREPATAYDGYIPVKYSTLKDLILPQFFEAGVGNWPNDNVATTINGVLGYNYIDLYAAGPTRDTQYGHDYRWKFTLSHSKPDYAYFYLNETTGNMSIANSNLAKRAQYTTYTSGGGSNGIATITSFGIKGYLTAPIPYFVARYYVVADTSSYIDNSQSIYNYNVTNVYNTSNDVQYIPYTPTSNPLDNPDWLETLKNVSNGNSVTVINIIISPEPTPAPTPTPPPEPGETPPPISLDIDFSTIEEGLQKVIENQGLTIDAINNMNYDIKTAINNANNDNLSALNNLQYQLTNEIRNVGADVRNQTSIISGLRNDIKNGLDDVIKQCKELEERTKGIGYILYLLLGLALMAFVLWICVSIWRLIWSRIIQVWL